jgi:hypothetical protein
MLMGNGGFFVLASSLCSANNNINLSCYSFKSSVAFDSFTDETFTSKVTVAGDVEAGTKNAAETIYFSNSSVTSKYSWYVKFAEGVKLFFY